MIWYWTTSWHLPPFWKGHYGIRMDDRHSIHIPHSIKAFGVLTIWSKLILVLSPNLIRFNLGSVLVRQLEKSLVISYQIDYILFKHSPLFQHFQTDICPMIFVACASGSADMYMERIYIAIFDRHGLSLHFMEPPIKRRTVDWNWSFGDKGYVFIEVIYRRTNNIKFLNEMMMVKSFECFVITRNMICHNVEDK